MYETPSISRALGPMKTGAVTTDDGACLRYQLFGQQEGPTVLIANGIGVRYWGFTKQIEVLRPTHRIICWDYRGMGDSTMADPDGDVSMPRHALDARLLMDHLGVEQAVLVGWSMGVQVSLELIRAWPQRASGLVAMLGTYGKPFRTGLLSPLAPLVETLFGFGQRHPDLPQGILEFAVAFPGLTYNILSATLFAGFNVDREILDADIAGVRDIEKSLYMRTLLALADHDASDMLQDVPCPALVICGNYDWVTPPRSGRLIADNIPGGQYREVKGGTHFALIERPDLINKWLLELVARTT